MLHHSGLLRAINSTSGERAIHRYLKCHPEPILYVFDRGWQFELCISEFEFANDFRADFAVLGAHSGACFVYFVELESPSARLYLKDGTPSKALRIALRQTRDWQEWIRRDPDGLRKCLRKAIRLRVNSGKVLVPDDATKAYARLSAPETFIEAHFCIVIARRDRLALDEQRRRATEPLHSGGVQIATYDRLLDAARLLDARGRQHHSRPRKGR